MSRQPGVGENERIGDASEFELPERDLAGALHEVSNALTVVLGWLECAQEDLGTNDVVKRAVDIAMSHAKLGRRLARRAIGDDSDTLAEEADLETLVRDVVTGVEREALRRQIKLSVNSDFTSRAKLVKGAGCKNCNGSGYRGRVALYEVMRFSDSLKEMVLQGASTAELKTAAIKGGMSTLRMSGIEKVLQGVTTTEEVGRVTMGD